MTPRQIKSMRRDGFHDRDLFSTSRLESITLWLVLLLTAGLVVVLWVDSRPMVACLDVNTFAACSDLDKGSD